MEEKQQIVGSCRATFLGSIEEEIYLACLLEVVRASPLDLFRKVTLAPG